MDVILFAEEQQDSCELPQLSEAHMKKYDGFWNKYKKSASTSSLDGSMPGTPTSAAPTTPASTALQWGDSQDLDSVMQMARQCPQTRAYLIQMLGLDSESVPVNAAPAALGGMGPPSISVPLKQEMMPTPLPSAPAAVPVKQEVPAPLPTPAPSAAAGSTGLPPQGHPEATEPNDELMAELGTRCTSKTHPNAYRQYGRYVLRNPDCQELSKAWRSIG